MELTSLETNWNIIVGHPFTVHTYAPLLQWGSIFWTVLTLEKLKIFCFRIEILPPLVFYFPSFGVGGQDWLSTLLLVAQILLMRYGWMKIDYGKAGVATKRI